MSTPNGPRIGSMFSGYGGLDMAVMDVFGGSVAWHCQWEPPDKHGRPDKWQFAARILEHHWPDVPNHGDVSAIDWATVEPVDMVTAGFPCTDLSYAGLGAGIAEGTRSGLWFAVVRAVRALRPRILVLENVRAIVDRRPGLDVVLADLADLGFDAEWVCVKASDVGAPHSRDRWFCLARLSDSDVPRGQWSGPTGRPAERHTPGADRSAADAQSLGRGQGWAESERLVGGPDAPFGGPSAATDTDLGGQRADQYDLCSRESDARRRTAADSSRNGHEDQPRHGHQGQFVAQPGAGGRTGDRPDASGDRGPGPGAGVVDWGRYEPAIRRWERILGRPAPRPVDDRGRLAPELVEWMMGLPEGHICSVPAPPGMSEAGLRNAQLKAGGNGVVRQQGAYAIRILDTRMRGQEVAA